MRHVTSVRRVAAVLRRAVVFIKVCIKVFVKVVVNVFVKVVVKVFTNYMYFPLYIKIQKCKSYLKYKKYKI